MWTRSPRTLLNQIKKSSQRYQSRVLAMTVMQFIGLHFVVYSDGILQGIMTHPAKTENIKIVVLQNPLYFFYRLFSGKTTVCWKLILPDDVIWSLPTSSTYVSQIVSHPAKTKSTKIVVLQNPQVGCSLPVVLCGLWDSIHRRSDSSLPIFGAFSSLLQKLS